MKTIEINSPKYGAHYTYVDDEDYELVSKYTWSLVVKPNGSKYARTKFRGDDGVYHTTSIHKMICGYDKTDHVDGNGLNNCRDNLRECTAQQNAANMTRKNKKDTSKYKGVFRTTRSKRNPWMCAIWVGGKSIHLGYFPSEESAAQAYDNAARQHFGEFAKVNL